MPSITMEKGIPLLKLTGNSPFGLASVVPRYRYENGRRTDKIEGFVYTAISIRTFDQFQVFVPGDRPVIEQSKLIELQEAGEQQFVQFRGAVLRTYYSERTHSIEDSVKANAVQLVQPDDSDMM